MPFYMHQWVYKDEQINGMVTTPQDRSEIIRVATSAFGGRIHQFFFSFGEYDGVAISEFPDAESALACLMSIFGDGRLVSMKTTVLFTSNEATSSMEKARKILGGERPSRRL